MAKFFGIDINLLRERQIDYMATKIISIAIMDLLNFDDRIKIKQGCLKLIDEYIIENELTSEEINLLSKVKTKIRKL